jgi:hypothetical protein
LLVVKAVATQLPQVNQGGVGIWYALSCVVGQTNMYQGKDDVNKNIGDFDRGNKTVVIVETNMTTQKGTKKAPKLKPNYAYAMVERKGDKYVGIVEA